MNKLAKSILLLFAVCATLTAEFFGPHGTWTTLRYGPSFAWPSAPGAPLAAVAPDKDQVIALLKEITPDWNYDFTDLIDFRFEPLVKGKFFLLVTEPNPKAEDGVFDAIYCEQNRCFLDTIPTLIDIRNDIVDVDGDGAFEVIAKECIADCSGVFRRPIFTYSIYKFIYGKGFTDFSREASDYYQKHLLPKIIASRENDGSAASQYAYDDYRRRVLGETEAGMENVMKWLPSERDLALRTLAHIDSPAAEAKLHDLLKSSDPDLAELAEGFLELRRQLRAGGVLK